MTGPALLVGFDQVESSDERMLVRLWPGHGSRPVWTYWFPLLTWLSAGAMRPVSVTGPAPLRARYIYPIELRYEADEWCANSDPGDLLVVLPPAVERSVAAGQVLIVVSIAHEGRPLFSAADPSSGLLLDRLAGFARWYGLAPERLWFLSGNLSAESELRAWCQHRGLARPPVTLRACEPFSGFIGRSARECSLHGRVPSATVRFGRRGPHEIGWQATELTWARQPFPGLGQEAATAPARYRFACLNRAFRSHRWHVLQRLWRDDLARHGLVSFPAPAPADLLAEGVNAADAGAAELLAKLPLTFDRTTSFDDQAYFGDNSGFVSLHPPAVLRDCAMELVTETRQAGCPFVSEKTFKALLGRGPAVVIGTEGTLDYLHSIGASTWPDLVDEGYDDIADPDVRFDAAMEAAVRLIGRPDWEQADAVTMRSDNTRWLIEARKPWDELTAELGGALTDL